MIWIIFSFEFLYYSTICSSNSCKQRIAWLYFCSEFDITSTSRSNPVILFDTSRKTKSSMLDYSCSC